MTKENPKALKHMYGEDFLRRLNEAFGEMDFLPLLPELLKLEMKPRVLRVRDELRKKLPEDFLKALNVILKAHRSGKLKGFDYWPLTECIQAFGLSHPEKSLEALKLLTVPFTGEFAVRPFIAQDPKKTLLFLHRCTNNEHPSVRRWASEGSRPRLPWGQKLHLLIEDPSLTLPILHALKFDPALFVRKSVANHLNDIAKDHPDLVVRTLSSWKKEARGEEVERIQWIERHALRTLIKQGHPRALKSLGAPAKLSVAFRDFRLGKKTLRGGERLDFEFEVVSTGKGSQKLIVDYRINFAKARGKSSPKVFKLKTLELGAGERIRVTKSHQLKEVTTRKLYPGKHSLEILINGKVYQKSDWKLLI